LINHYCRNIITNSLEPPSQLILALGGEISAVIAMVITIGLKPAMVFGCHQFHG
jgi:hypothetical protein